MPLIDSHDTDRVASVIVNASNERPYQEPDRSDYVVSGRVSPRLGDAYDVRKPNERERRIQRIVALMQATFLGAPTFYDGTEAGMWGADDPCDRVPMVRADKQYEDQRSDPLGRQPTADEVAFDHELHQFYRSVIALHRDSTALRRGGFRIVATDDAQRLLDIERSDGRQSCVVVLNRGESQAEVQLPLPSGDYEIIFSAASEPDRSFAVRKGESLIVRLPGLDGVVLRQAPPPE